LWIWRGGVLVGRRGWEARSEKEGKRVVRVLRRVRAEWEAEEMNWRAEPELFYVRECREWSSVRQKGT